MSEESSAEYGVLIEEVGTELSYYRTKQSGIEHTIILYSIHASVDVAGNRHDLAG